MNHSQIQLTTLSTGRRCHEGCCSFVPDMELEGDNKEQRSHMSKTGQSNTEQEQQLSMQTSLNTAFHCNLCLFYKLYSKNSHVYKWIINMADNDTAHKLFYSTTMQYFSMALLPHQIQSANSEWYM